MSDNHLTSRRKGTRERLLRSVSVNETTGCWEWILTKERPPLLPYGRFYFGKRYRHAHRVMYETEHGEIPVGMCVLHRCDNPPCINPAHLFLGTLADNAVDRDAKGRTASGDRSGARLHPEKWSRGDSHWTRRCPEKLQRGERHGRAKLTFEQVREIRSKRTAGATLLQLSTEYGIGKSTIAHIINGDTWKEE